MKIVVDTNVMISGIFFGGNPQKVLRAIVSNEIDACATTEIIDEYEDIDIITAKEFCERYHL